jgi:hypothetical protein
VFSKRIFTTVLIVAAMACSSNPSPGSGSERPTSNADVITAAELADPTVQSGDALQAVQRLRPRFLMSRGMASAKNTSAGSVHLSVDGGSLLTVDNLSRYSPSAIVEIRYISSIDAAQRWGTAAGSGGVILVKSK